MDSHDPAWLRFLSRRIGWLALPNIAMVFVALQVFGFLFLMTSPPGAGEQLALIPEFVLRGEIWRFLSFLALPLSMSPLWLAFALWFEYFILHSIEEEWGSFRTTFYILVSIVLTSAFSLIFDYPVLSVKDFTATLFLAAAALFPETEIRMYLAIPVKMKYMGWAALCFLLLRLIQGSWIDRLFLVTIYSNYLLFFGPSLVYQVKQWKRRRDYRAKWRD